MLWSPVKDSQPFPIQVIESFITKDNIISLFLQATVPKEMDLLSIDIDGNDYWVWQALKDYSPRIAIIEYNASHYPDKEWIMPYDASHQFDNSNYFGASLKSLSQLGSQLGYTLVCCDSCGVNAFFVRNDLIGTHFTHTQDGPSYHYCAPKYKDLFFGHPPR